MRFRQQEPARTYFQNTLATSSSFLPKIPTVCPPLASFPRPGTSGTSSMALGCLADGRQDVREYVLNAARCPSRKSTARNRCNSNRLSRGVTTTASRRASVFFVRCLAGFAVGGRRGNGCDLFANDPLFVGLFPLRVDVAGVASRDDPPQRPKHARF